MVLAFTLVYRTTRRRPVTKIHLPDNLELGRQIGTLVGRTARVIEVEGRNKFDGSSHSAYYVTREDDLAGFCVVDLPLSGYLGAALAMIPADTAQEEINAGELQEELLECYYEVANIMWPRYSAPMVLPTFE